MRRPCPMVPITFLHRGVRIPALGLADTGADQTLLPLAFATEFGFTFYVDADKVAWEGAGSQTFFVYQSPEPIDHVIEGKGFRPVRWKAHVGFTLSQPTILLGRRGFFDRFDVLFKGKDKGLRLEEC